MITQNDLPGLHTPVSSILTPLLGPYVERRHRALFRAGRLHFVYTPMPHVILTAQADGSSEKIYSTSFGPLRKVVQEYPHVRPGIRRGLKFGWEESWG